MEPNGHYQTRKTLILRLKEGGDPSWEEFFQLYRPYIQAIVRNMNIPASDADDIAQQVMIRLWKHIEKYSPERRFRSWLSTIVVNCVKDFIRDRARDAERQEKMARDRSLPYLRAIRLPEVEQIAEREWGIYLSKLALERVESLFSGKAIEVFSMSLDGLSVEEIARRTGLKENSVYRLRNRVKKQVALEIQQLRLEME